MQINVLVFSLSFIKPMKNNPTINKTSPAHDFLSTLYSIFILYTRINICPVSLILMIWPCSFLKCFSIRKEDRIGKAIRLFKQPFTKLDMSLLMIVCQWNDTVWLVREGLKKKQKKVIFITLGFYPPTLESDKKNFYFFGY